MLKTLLRKQMTEIFRTYFYDTRKSKPRSKASTIFLFVMFGVLMIGVLGTMFTLLSVFLCAPLTEAGLAWMYFTVMALLAILLGAFGSVFNTFAGLYLAKDNDLLLSMPIPVRYILAARLLGVYLLGLMYSGVLLLPAVIVYWCMASFSLQSVLGGILLILTVSGIVLFLSCALGWVVAQISRKLRNKSLITVLISLIFIGAYYFFYAKAQSLMQDLIANADSYGAKIRGAAYPLYLLGRMGVGDPVALLVWIAGTAFVLFLTLYIIARGFIRLATSTGTVARTAYREKKARVASPAGALRRREFARFLGSPTYMLNCGLGSVIGVAFAGFLLIRNSWAYENLSVLSEAVGIGIPRFAPIAAAAVCMVLSTVAITAPSVSLEGRTIWLSQSLPVTPWQVLRAKLAVHLWVGEIPALLCGVAVAAALRLPFPTAVMTVILPLLFTLLQACFGLFVNLLHPNLTWVSEMTPIKQSLGVLFSLLGGWGYAALLGVGGYFLTVPVPAWVALLALNLLTALLSLLLLRWLKGRGARIFATL